MHNRLYAEIMDSLDEELELELDDERFDAIITGAGYKTGPDEMDRRLYFPRFTRRAR